MGAATKQGKKRNVLGPYTDQESNSNSSTVNRRRGLKSRLCSYPLFLMLHLLGHKTWFEPKFQYLHK